MSEHIGVSGARNQSVLAQNVVEFQKEPLDMRFSILNEVEAYWEGLRNGRTLPARSDVDPRGIERALEYSFIIERVSPGVARFRVAGRHLNDLMGMDVRGMPLTAYFHADARDHVIRRTTALFDDLQIIRLAMNSAREPQKPSMDGAMLLLPLLNEKGVVSRALGCLATDGSIGRVPRRFRVTRSSTRDLSGDWHQAPSDASEFQPGFSDTAQTRAPRPPKRKPGDNSRPALRLVKGGD